MDAKVGMLVTIALLCSSLLAAAASTHTETSSSEVGVGAPAQNGRSYKIWVNPPEETKKEGDVLPVPPRSITFDPAEETEEISVETDGTENNLSDASSGAKKETNGSNNSNGSRGVPSSSGNTLRVEFIALLIGTALLISFLCLLAYLLGPRFWKWVKLVYKKRTGTDGCIVMSDDYLYDEANTSADSVTFVAKKLTFDPDCPLPDRWGRRSRKGGWRGATLSRDRSSGGHKRGRVAETPAVAV